MKVYIVVRPAFDDFEILNVCKTLERAKLCIELYKEKYDVFDLDEISIHEHEVIE